MVSLHIKWSKNMVLESSGICATSLSTCQPKDTHHSSLHWKDVLVHQLLWGDNNTNHCQTMKGLFLPAHNWGTEGGNKTKLITAKQNSWRWQNTSNFALIPHDAFLFQFPRAAHRHVRGSCPLGIDWVEKNKRVFGERLWCYWHTSP